MFYKNLNLNIGIENIFDFKQNNPIIEPARLTNILMSAACWQQILLK
jgi:hypothetical protein